MVARSKDRLVDLAGRLSDDHRVDVEVLTADLTLEEDLAAVVRRICDGGPIDLVINNAGVGWYGRFVDEPPLGVEQMLALDVTALTLLSRAALEAMVARGTGGLLNVSSTASFVPGPRAALYHACKAFVTSFTEALHEEARPHGIHVTALCPGITPTGFQRAAGFGERELPRLLLSDARRVAEEGLCALERNVAVCIPGALNKLAATAARLSPRSAVRQGTRRVLEAL